MIDAAGAIYVIGGSGSAYYYQDVWVSTNGGAWPDSRRGTQEGTKVGTQGVLGGTMGY